MSITPGFQAYAEGSALIMPGDTRVVCAVSLEERVPEFLRGKGCGWITSEIDLGLVEKTRRQFPFFKDSRRDLY